jgi:leader peptidase (prepilin peptidase)/N-methyltransferase
LLNLHQISTFLLPVGWGVIGCGVGLGVRRANVWLAQVERHLPGHERWQILGPILLMPALFAIFAWRIGSQPLLLLRCLWVAVLVQIIFFDAEHRLILARVLLPAGLAAVALSNFTPGLGWQPALIAGAAAGGLFFLIALVGGAIFGTEAMGLGDALLAAFIGLILGMSTGPALLAGVVLAGIVAALLVIFRLRTMRDSIPYGPFLSAGALLELFLSS